MALAPRPRDTGPSRVVASQGTSDADTWAKQWPQPQLCRLHELKMLVLSLPHALAGGCGTCAPTSTAPTLSPNLDANYSKGNLYFFLKACLLILKLQLYSLNYIAHIKGPKCFCNQKRNSLQSSIFRQV